MAVNPKAFHQTLADFSDDAQLCITIERDTQEELFGRDDLDDGRRRADPLQPSHFTDPMR